MTFSSLFGSYCSVAQSCLTLCNPMDCRMPGLPVLHYLPEFAQTHVHWVSDVIQPSHPLLPFSSCPQSFPASRSFPVSWLFASNDQSIGSFSFSMCPSNEYSGLLSFRMDWFDLLAVQVQKYQFFGTQPSLWSKCDYWKNIHTWLLEKP